MTSYVERVFASMGLRAVGIGLQFVISVLSARLLGVEGFGVYTYAFVWVTLLGGIAHLGFAQLTSRELPRYVAAGDGGGGRSYLRFAATATLLAVAAISAGLAGAQLAGLDVPLGWPLLALGVALNAGGSLLGGSLAGLQRILQPQMIEIVVRPTVMFIGLGVMILLPDLATPMAVYLLALGASGIAMTGSAILLRGGVDRALPPAPAAASRTEGRVRRAWLTGALALLATSITTMMMTNLDILMIGAMTPPEEVGRYRAASRGVDLILIATGVAIFVMGPMLAKALAESRDGEARGLIMRASVTMAVTGLPLCAVLLFGAEFYLGLFGPDFVPAATAMQILVIGQVVAIGCGPATMALVMLKRERLVLVMNLAALLANLGLNLALIPIYGLEGAAVATLVSVSGVKIAMAVALLREGYDPTLVAPARGALRRWRS